MKHILYIYDLFWIHLMIEIEYVGWDEVIESSISPHLILLFFTKECQKMKPLQLILQWKWSTSTYLWLMYDYENPSSCDMRSLILYMDGKHVCYQCQWWCDLLKSKCMPTFAISSFWRLRREESGECWMNLNCWFESTLNLRVKRTRGVHS